MSKEFKQLSFANIKSESQGRVRAGVCAVFGNIDSGKDITHKGAFTKTLAEGRKRWKHLWNHDSSRPPTAKVLDIYEIDRHELPEKVLEFAPDATGGLYVKREYLTSHPDIDWILECIDEGIIDEMSYAFDIDKKDFSEINGEKIRNLREVILYDTSDVNYGMNAATVGSGMKNAFSTMPLGLIYSNLLAISDEIKAGRRNSDSDQKLLDMIHKMSVDLGATCAVDDGEKSAGEIADEKSAETGEEKAEAADNSGTSLGNDDWLKLKQLELETL